MCATPATAPTTRQRARAVSSSSASTTAVREGGGPMYAILQQRRGRYLASLLLALAILGIFVVPASGDAGNPILGTIRPTLVLDNPADPAGGVTVYVRG